METFIIRQIDTVVTEFVCEAKDKEEAEEKWYNMEVEENEPAKTVDRVIEIEKE